jgi:hypothetical protein
VVVPRDHHHRRQHRLLDLSFVRTLAAACYATGVRPASDPEICFRLQRMKQVELSAPMNRIRARLELLVFRILA